MLQHLERMRAVLAQIKFPEFNFIVTSEEQIIYFQIECHSRCNVTGAALSWKGRKWLMSIHMTDGEIVQTAFKAVMTAMEHEVREQFSYKGVTIFDPHYDIDKLVDLRTDPKSIRERAPMPTQLRWAPCIDCNSLADCGTAATCIIHPTRSQVA